jgi:phage baseplate assembly protein gpV
MLNNAVTIGVVVAAYPQGNAVDILLPHDGSRLFSVPVEVPSGSSGTGVVDLPDIGLPLDESRWQLTAKPEYYVRAVVHFPNGLPVVSGFLLPPDSQLLFTDKNRRIVRHASDVYTSLDQNGNFELFHPSGFYVRIGTSTAHEDLTAKDIGKKWAIKKNTGNAVHFFVSQPNGTSIDLAPDGSLKINTTSTVNVTAGGAATVKAPSATIDSPSTHCTGTLQVDGKITGTGGLAISGGGSGAAATITGTMAVTGGDVTADSISLKGHKHGGVQTGSGTTGTPQ